RRASRPAPEPGLETLLREFDALFLALDGRAGEALAVIEALPPAASSDTAFYRDLARAHALVATGRQEQAREALRRITAGAHAAADLRMLTTITGPASPLLVEILSGRAVPYR